MVKITLEARASLTCSVCFWGINSSDITSSVKVPTWCYWTREEMYIISFWEPSGWAPALHWSSGFLAEWRKFHLGTALTHPRGRLKHISILAHYSWSCYYYCLVTGEGQKSRQWCLIQGAGSNSLTAGQMKLQITPRIQFIQRNPRALYNLIRKRTSRNRRTCNWNAPASGACPGSVFTKDSQATLRPKEASA